MDGMLILRLAMMLRWIGICTDVRPLGKMFDRCPAYRRHDLHGYPVCPVILDFHTDQDFGFPNLPAPAFSLGLPTEKSIVQFKRSLNP